jgi:hypothetical protein
LNEGGRSGRFRPGSSTIWWNSVATLLSSIINSLCKLLRSSLGRIPTSSRHCNRSVTKCHRRKNCVISSLNMDVSDIKHVGSSVLTRQVDEIVHRQHDTHTKSHKLICPGHDAPQSMTYSFTSVGKLSVYVRGGLPYYMKNLITQNVGSLASGIV